jgi:hypothetical protein
MGLRGEIKGMEPHRLLKTIKSQITRDKSPTFKQKKTQSTQRECKKNINSNVKMDEWKSSIVTSDRSKHFILFTY